MTYSGTVSVDAGALHSGVKAITQDLNNILQGFGVDRAVTVRTEIGAFSFDGPPDLGYARLNEIRQRVEAIMREKQPEWDFRVGQLIAQ